MCLVINYFFMIVLVVFQENVTLKDAIGGDGSVVPRVELER